MTTLPPEGPVEKANSETNPFWEFSILVYGNEEVRDACLDAQEVYGADVNLLLLCCWLGFVGIKLTPEGIRRLDTLVDGWRREAILPLRTVRKRLKGTIGPVPSDLAADVRNTVKQAELQAERIEQDLLYSALQTLPGRDGRDAERSGVARQNLQLYATEILNLPSVSAMRGAIEDILEGCRSALEAEADSADC